MGKRISQLDAAAPVTGSEQIAIVQETRTKRMYLSDLRTYTDTSCQCTLVSRYDTVGTDADTKIKYLQTYQMPANTLSTDGSWLEVFAWGTLANAGNAKTIYFNFGAYTFSTGLFSGDGTWEIKATIIRLSDTTQKILVVYEVPTVISGTAVSDALTETLTTQISFSIAAKNNVASANDVSSQALIIRLNKMDTNS